MDISINFKHSCNLKLFTIFKRLPKVRFSLATRFTLKQSCYFFKAREHKTRICFNFVLEINNNIWTCACRTPVKIRSISTLYTDPTAVRFVIYDNFFIHNCPCAYILMHQHGYSDFLSWRIRCVIKLIKNKMAYWRHFDNSNWTPIILTKCKH